MPSNSSLLLATGGFASEHCNIDVHQNHSKVIGSTEIVMKPSHPKFHNESIQWFLIATTISHSSQS